MASQRILSLLIFIAYYCSLSLAAPWIVTKYFQQDAPVESTATDDMVVTSQQWVTLTVDQPEAVRTTTTVDYEVGVNDYIDKITYVNVFVEPSQGKHFTETLFEGYQYYHFYVTQTWPESCSPSSGTYVTDSSVRVPYQINWAMHPTSTSTVVTQYYTTEQPSTSEKLFIDPTDVPKDLMSSAMASPTEHMICSTYEDDPFNYDEEPWRCYELTWKAIGIRIGGERCCPDGCHRTWGLEPWHLAPIIICSWFGFWLLIGIIHNMIGFRELMMGERATRGIPGPFICLLPILSCALLLITRKGFEARSPEERAELRSKWEAMSIFTRAKLWLRWGFSYKYPPFLGTPPATYSFRKPHAKDQYEMNTTTTATTNDTQAMTRREEDGITADPPPPAYTTN